MTTTKRRKSGAPLTSHARDRKNARITFEAYADLANDSRPWHTLPEEEKDAWFEAYEAARRA